MTPLWYFVSGYVIIEIEAVRVEQALSNIAEAGIALAAVHRLSHSVALAKVACADYKKLCRAISGVARVTVKSFGGMRSLFSFLKRHLVFVIGIALAVLLAFGISRFCFKMEIVGIVNMDAEDISRVVEENGIAPVMLKSNIDLDAVERAIWKAYPDLTYVYASFHGVTLRIEVREGIPAPEIHDTQPSSIYASNSGVITEIVVYSGRAVVKVGDRVQKGDLLITGNYEVNGFTFSVAAGGKVTARTEYITSVISEADCTELIPTGRIATERVMLFLNRRIHVSGENPFSTYIEELSVTSALGENTPAYLQIGVITYREAERVNSEEKTQHAIDAATQAAYDEVISKLPDNAKVCCFYTYVDDSTGEIRVTLTLSAYEQIGVRGGVLSSFLPDSDQ